MEKYLYVGSVLFWLFNLVALGALVTAAVHESAVAATIIVGLFAGLLWLFFGVETWEYLPHTWYGWLFGVGGYLVLGLVWSFYKFYVTYRREVQEMRELKPIWLTDNRRLRPALTDEERSKEWSEHVDARCPHAYSMKDAIICWIAYWPISIVVYLFADLLLESVEWLYRQFSGMYERIAINLRNSIKD